MHDRYRMAPIGPSARGAGRAGLFKGSLALAVAASVLLPEISAAAPVHGKRNHLWHGYGFLPGYRTPEQIEWETEQSRRPAYWYGGPGFYRGRWNGGGFGPCWTPTPIGPQWHCG
jgi:hypothetical protein